MGCYDMILLETICPYCGLKSEMEFQTKNLENLFNVYRKGDKITDTELKYIVVIGECHSPICQEKADKLGIAFQGCPSGFGSTFGAKIELKKGIVTGKIYGIIRDKEFTDKHIEKIREKWEKKYKPRKKKDLIYQEWEKRKR